MSDRKNSPKKSPKKSPKSGGRGSPNKGSKLTAEELAERERKYFARKRYDIMDAIFTRKSPAISLYIRSIHLYEIWNRLPPYEQFCNSNIDETNESNKKSPKGSKASPKKSPKKSGAKPNESKEEPQKPEYEPAVITGVICVQKSHLPINKKLFIEVTAKFRYVGHSKVPPFPQNVLSDCLCFRDVIAVYPVSFDSDRELSEFNQNLIVKLRKTMGRGYRLFPFSFDVTRKPDSIFFTRPFYPDYSSGLFWRLRAYIAQEENCDALPNEQISMEFFKYTITPTITAVNSREAPTVQYTRFSTQGDTGDLILQAQLERDVYYHGQEIKVKIHIENNSSRHVVSTIAVFVEQTYRLFHQFPHDSSIPLGEILLKSGENGIPIQPRNKNWTKDVIIKPTYDPTKYNLAIDGKMQTDNKIFLASSTVVMMGNQVIVTTTQEEPPEVKQSPKGSPKGKKTSPKEKSSPKKRSPSKGGKSPNRNKSPSKNKQQEQIVKIEEEPAETAPKTKTTITEVNSLTNKQACRSAFVSYDVVVRLNLRTPHGDESGHPMVRLPFILTRETRFLDKFNNPPPPTWATVQPH